MKFLKLRNRTIINIEMIVDIDTETNTIWLVNDYQYKLSVEEFEALMEEVSKNLI